MFRSVIQEQDVSMADTRQGIFSVMSFEGSTDTYRKWVDLTPEQLGDETQRRNGRFQVMLSFMRLSLMASIVVDSTGRLIFLNNLAEQYWKCRLWDVRGKHLSEVLRQDLNETSRSQRERERILAGGKPEIFIEHFHQGSQRISMFCFPFLDDHDELLMGAFILPHGGNLGPQPGY